MKKLLFFLPLLLVACAGETDPADEARTGMYYASVAGSNEIFELFPGRSKTFDIKACADRENGDVSNKVLNFSFKAEPDSVEVYNAANGTDYTMCPGSAFEFVTNDVMMPRYGAASTTAKIRLSTSGLEDGVTYILPLAIDQVTGTDDWVPAAKPVAYLVFRMKYIPPEAGRGTKDDPYYLYTAEDLTGMYDMMEEGVKVYFRLMNDIDMSSVRAWMPLNFAQPYTRMVDFDGNNHTISNFYCDAPNYASFFGVLYGNCYDLSFTDAFIEVETGSCCGIVGAYCGTSGDITATATNVHVQGKVVCTGGVNGIGGLFGRVHGTLNNCSADCQVEGAGKYIGGLFGYDSGKSEIWNCWSAGSVKGQQSVGGIAGGLIKAGSSVYNCYSTSSVRGSFGVGGIVGHANLDKGASAALPDATSAENVVEKCIAWNGYVHATNTDGGEHYSSGAIVGYGCVNNYLTDCWRRSDLDFQECTGNSSNVLVNQDDANPTSPLSIKKPGTYNFAYHGKAAAAEKTLSEIAKGLGWPDQVWDFSGKLPVHRSSASGGNGDGGNESNGQLPDFDENAIY